MHTLLPPYMSKILISIDYLETYITPQALPVIFINPQNVIIIPNRWNKIKLCLCFSTCIFIVKQGMIFCQQLTCGIWQDETFMMSIWEKFTICENWKIFRNSVGKKNSTDKNCKIERKRFVFKHIYDNTHAWICIKCTMSILNWNYPIFLIYKRYKLMDMYIKML